MKMQWQNQNLYFALLVTIVTVVFILLTHNGGFTITPRLPYREVKHLNYDPVYTVRFARLVNYFLFMFQFVLSTMFLSLGMHLVERVEGVLAKRWRDHGTGYMIYYRVYVLLQSVCTWVPMGCRSFRCYSGCFVSVDILLFVLIAIFKKACYF